MSASLEPSARSNATSASRVVRWIGARHAERPTPSANRPHPTRPEPVSLRQEGARESSIFAYDAAWLDRDDRFEIDPLLPLQAGFHLRNFHFGPQADLNAW